MSHNLTYHPELPLVIRTVTGEFEYAAHQKIMIANDVLLFNGLTEPVYYLLDSDVGKIEFENMLAVFAHLTKQAQTLRHPMLIEGLIIVADELMAMAIKEMSSPLLGGLRIRAFYSVEEAIDYVRANTR